MDPAFEEQRGRVVRDINSLLISVCEGKGIPIDRITSMYLNRVTSHFIGMCAKIFSEEYRLTFGCPIPINHFGFTHIQDFLNYLTKIFPNHGRDKEGNFVIKANLTQENVHIARMKAAERPKRKKKRNANIGGGFMSLRGGRGGGGQRGGFRGGRGGGLLGAGPGRMQHQGQMRGGMSGNNRLTQQRGQAVNQQGRPRTSMMNGTNNRTTTSNSGTKPAMTADAVKKAPLCPMEVLWTGRIMDLVADSTQGIWASRVEILYVNKFKKRLPSNWVQAVKNRHKVCPLVFKDGGFGR